MSKRFLRWVELWIDDHVAPGSGGDIEPYDIRASKLSDELLTKAAGEGFRQEEIDEETHKIAGLIEARLSTKPEFDLSQFGAPGGDD